MNVKEEENTGSAAVGKDEVFCTVNHDSLIKLSDAFKLTTAQEMAEIFLSHDKLVADILDS
jgi:hypothetical protein